MLRVTVGGNVLGVIWTDRGETERPRSLSMSLQTAERIVDKWNAPGSMEPPKLRDLGKGTARFVLQTERVFESPSDAAMWVLDLADLRGFAGEVVFEAPDGAGKKFEYGIATPGGTSQTGATVFVGWSLEIGRKC